LLLATLLALIGAELLYEFAEGLRHDAGPPAQATATFSPRRSIRSHDPGVNTQLRLFGRGAVGEESGVVSAHRLQPWSRLQGGGAAGLPGCTGAGARSRRASGRRDAAAESLQCRPQQTAGRASYRVLWPARGLP